jgi:hypothetical protein
MAIYNFSISRRHLYISAVLLEPAQISRWRGYAFCDGKSEVIRRSSQMQLPNMPVNVFADDFVH